MLDRKRWYALNVANWFVGAVICTLVWGISQWIHSWTRWQMFERPNELTGLWMSLSPFLLVYIDNHAASTVQQDERKKWPYMATSFISAVITDIATFILFLAVMMGEWTGALTCLGLIAFDALALRTLMRWLIRPEQNKT